jgi:hypothetical protein
MKFPEAPNEISGLASGRWVVYAVGTWRLLKVTPEASEHEQP